MESGTLIDTHAHLYLPQFDDDIENVIQRANDSGISKILLPNIDLSTISSMIGLTQDYPSVCYSMIGLHPCSVSSEYLNVLNQIEKLLSEGEWVGIGETGVDLYWDKIYQDEQILSFKRHIEWSKDLGLPIVIHSRESLELNIEIIEEMQDGNLSGVFHCFNGTPDQARRITDAGMMMGIGGVITFKNAGVDLVIPYLDKDHIILETDAPYLAPSPFRGKRNESSYLLEIADFLASRMDIERSEVADMTTSNAISLFPGIIDP